jgi:hypothetical protein
MERVNAESGATCEVCHEPLTTTDLNESEHRCERHPMVEEASSAPLRRALAKRGPSPHGWRWIKPPTKAEREAFNRLLKAKP